MTKLNQLYTIPAGLVVSLAIHSAGYAQDVVSQPTKRAMTAEQGETFDAPVALIQASTLPASWKGQEFALNGNDVVSYFQGDEALAGSEVYSVEYDDTTWRFSSEENRDLFAKNPNKYIPEFGGYCPYALANNHAKIGTSTQYTVHGSKLYVNFDQTTRDTFRQSPDEYVLRAQLNF